VETKDLWLSELRQVSAVFEVGIVLAVGWRVVDTRWGELVSVLKDTLTVELIQDHFHSTSVEGLSHTTTVVALTSQVEQGWEWSLVWVLVQENGQLSHRDTQVGLVELILDVPAQGSEQTTFLDHSVEEDQTEQQLAELLWLGGAVEELLVADGVH
jgi:hypothetical protein